MKKQTTLKDKVFNYPTKFEQGFIYSEMEALLEEFPNINKEKFDYAMTGNTCKIVNEHIIIYHCDILKALRCGIENRDLNSLEFD